MNLRLYAAVAGMQARKLMSYRGDFWISAVVGFVAQAGILYALWHSLYREAGTAEIAGRTLAGTMLYYVVALLVSKVVRGNDNDHGMAEEIYSGGLTRFMLYPTNYFAFKFAQRAGDQVPSLVQLVAFGAIVPLLLPHAPEADMSAASIGLGLLAMVAASTLHYFLYLPVHAVAFWADEVWGLNVLVRMTSGFLGGLLLPLTVFPPWLREGVAWTPFPYLFSWPVETMLGTGKAGPFLPSLAMCVAWTLLFMAIGRLVWRRGGREYSGVGI
jgi:ABC-2 type transport system permease protein